MTRNGHLPYREFLASKRAAATAIGFEMDPDRLNPKLFDWQRMLVARFLRLGRSACFAECGAGKTGMQLEWAQRVCERTNLPGLILAPLAVAQQTRREGEKFGIPVTVCRTQKDVRPGVNVANYEMLQHFDPSKFGNITLDESGILKSFMGVTKQALCEAFSGTPYRLCCTATPAPNDHLELGNHAAFLGIMPSNEMIARWFINDSMKMCNYRLKQHAAADFWRWMTTWAVSLSTPADIGYPAGDFILPPLEIHQELVDAGLPPGTEDQLFGEATMSATTMHREMRRTNTARVERVAQLVSSKPGPWLVWCNTNYEADALKEAIPEAIDVRGTDPLELKEERVEAFSSGEARVLVSKPSMLGFGLNFQHCCQMAFVGLSYSYEQLYQALRRSWRFGQKNPVHAHIILAETEGAVLATIQRKQQDHERMKASMNAAMMAALHDAEDPLRRSLARYEPTAEMRLPRWLQKEPSP